MFDNKYLMLVLCFLSLLMTFGMANETYAKYISVATSSTSTSIARWKILINNDDITLGSTSTSLITPVFPGSNDISSNVIAPNAEGYFDLVIDASSVDVSFKYEISVAPDPSSPVSELVAYKYTVNNGEDLFFDDSSKIEETVRLNDTNKVKTVRVYVKWDDTLGLMTNSQDTNSTKNNQKATLNVTVSAIQI